MWPIMIHANWVCRTSTGEVGPIDILINNAGITKDRTFKRDDES
jgi:short-subunit dehydrogenase